MKILPLHGVFSLFTASFIRKYQCWGFQKSKFNFDLKYQIFIHVPVIKRHVHIKNIYILPKKTYVLGPTVNIVSIWSWLQRAELSPSPQSSQNSAERSEIPCQPCRSYWEMLVNHRDILNFGKTYSERCYNVVDLRSDGY
jgi:hypothetical protein